MSERLSDSDVVADLDYATPSPRLTAKQRWAARRMKSDRQAQTVRMNAGDAFALGFWAMIGAMAASLVVLIALFVFGLITGHALLH